MRFAQAGLRTGRLHTFLDSILLGITSDSTPSESSRLGQVNSADGISCEHRKGTVRTDHGGGEERTSVAVSDASVLDRRLF